MAKAYDSDGKTGSAALKDIYLRHGINLIRYSNSQARKLLDILDTANVQIRGIINKAKAVETKEKYYRIQRELKRITDDLNQELSDQVEQDFKGLAEVETLFVANSIKAAGVTVDFELPAPAKVWASASFGRYEGSGKETYESYLNTFGDNVYKTWDSNVRAGYLSGLTAKQINRAVLGSVPDMEPGQMQTLRKSLETNTKTMVAHLAGEARAETYRQNSDLFSGYRYVGTLDSRTCLECGVLDNQIFEGSEPPDDPELPQHPNCRCLWLPVIKGMEEFDDEDMRASVDGPVSANMTYEEWLKTQPDDVVMDILGKTRFDLFKMETPITSFIADGKTLNLKQLMENEGIMRVPVGVGAMATRIYVKRPYQLLDDYKFHLQEDSYVTDITVIAEGEQIRDVQKLINKYPLQDGSLTKKESWSKVKGIGYITDDDTTRYAELHWYQAKNIGKVEWKVKHYLD